MLDSLRERYSPWRLIDRRVQEGVDGRMMQLRKELAGRPNVDLVAMAQSEVQMPPFARHYDDLFDIADLSVVIRTCKYNLRKEIFRRGWGLTERFARRCDACEMDIVDVEHEVCPKCQQPTREPDTSQKEQAEAFFESVNENGQSLIEVLGQCEDDVNTVDDGWMVFRKEYWVDADGNVLENKLIEIVRGSPQVMRFVADEKAKLGGSHYVCLLHRDQSFPEPGRCRECGRLLYDAKYVSLESAGGSIDEYYVDGEVVHFSKYSPSMLYGHPPVLTLWNLAMALFKQEEFIKTTYDKKRVPSGIVSVVTSNVAGFRKFWDWLMSKLADDPHYIPFAPVEAAPGARGKIEFVKFMNTLDEMQYTSVRDEMRQRISALYGVTNIFMSDVSTSGGLNNEGLQITVTNRAVESAQGVYHEEVAPMLEAAMGLTDWQWELLPSEEEDEKAEIEREQIKVVVASQMQSMGFEVERDEEGEFTYSDKPTQSRMTTPGWFSTATDSNARRFGQSPRSVERKAIIGMRSNGVPVVVDEGMLVKYAGEQDELALGGQFKQSMKKVFEEEMDRLMRLTKRGMNREQLAGKMENAAKRITGRLKKLVRDFYVSMLNEGYHSVVDHFPSLSKQVVVDEWALKAILEDSPIWKAFVGFDEDLSKRIGEVIVEAFEKPEELFSPRLIRQRLLQIMDAEVFRLDRIARTETQAVAMKGRELAFRKMDVEGKARYEWIGPDDHRTSDLCREIKRRVFDEAAGKGVSLDRLNEIVGETSQQYMGAGWLTRDWTPHPNCRHGIVPVV